MKILKIVSLSLLLASLSINSTVFASANGLNKAAINYPAKTAIIKNPLAEDAGKFFATSTTINFEVYKVGSKDDIASLIASFTKNSDVESCNLGVTTGDFQAFTLVLKSTKDKQWFINAFKKAGLMTMKINNKPVVNTDAI
jgi:hypothetical protein